METISPHSGSRWVREWLDTALSVLFPHRCSGCRRPGTVFCATCAQSLLRLAPPICAACGKSVTGRALCRDCGERPPPVCARSYALYQGPLVSALLHMKYRPNRELAELMGTWLVDLYRGLRWQATLVVLVPLADKRRRHRGYNQSALVASALATTIGVPHDEEALHRIRETRSQVGLDPADRSFNVRGAFEARGESVRGKTVLVVDDLWTTGATLISCAEALLTAGANQVLGLTVARARGRWG